MRSLNHADEWIPSSTVEWARWIAEQEARTLRVYNEDPDRLIADYRRERQISRGYQGREILELLQNANDAASEENVRGKIRIELRAEGLIFANTGRPFTTGGVNSLRITDLSPKLRRKSRLIGQKGLGFRAVLNWSRQPYISSGSLRLVFSVAKMQSLCHELEKSNPSLAVLAAPERVNPNDVILPSLPFPMVVDGGIDLHHSQPQHNRNIAERCDALRDEFDTVIGMPFNDPATLDLAKRELQELRPEILLFADSIEQVTLVFPDGPEETWTISGQNPRKLTINGSSSSTRLYQIFRDHNSIPGEFLGEASSSEYEIVIAVPQDETPRDPQTFFSFFPTNVRFPFPVVCHATVELDSNRKYPTEGQPNYFIFGKVADLLASAAEHLESETSPWLKASTVARQQDYDTPFQKIEFGKRLLSSLRPKKIFPCVYGDFREPTNCVRMHADNLSWLPPQGFEDVCMPGFGSSVRRLLDELGVEALPSAALRDRLNALTFASLEERAEVVAGLINENLTPRDPAPSLLIDEVGNAIPSNERVYFAPELGQKEYTRPSWLKLHFVDDRFRQEITRKLGVSDRRDLRQKLEPFGVQEYALAGVASAIAVEARRQMDAYPDQEATYQQDMLIALFDLFPETGDVAKLPETTAVPLPTLAGNYADARHLYFSEGYSGNGRLLASLYSRRPDLLIAPPLSMGLDGESPQTIAFLKWLGVASWPREVKTDHVEQGFINHILDNVTYPMKTEKYLRASRSDFYRPFVKNITTIEGLDDILRSNAAGVIAWLALDSRAHGWLLSSGVNGELYDRPSGTWYDRRFSTSIPSFIKWRIQNTAWLPTISGELIEPRRCMLGERGLDKLLPPPAEFSHELFDFYKINARLKRNAYENAGVTPDISHLDPEQIYEMIGLMPKVDPSGKHARNFYRTLLERIDTDMRIWPEVPKSFIQSAMMLGSGPDGVKYYPVRQLVHADSEDIPELLCRNLTLVDLPKRVGSLKVRRLFGIEPVDRKKIVQRIRRFVELPETKDIQVQFERTKPYLYYLRNVRSKQTSELTVLQKLQVVLCSSIEVDIEYEPLKVSSTFEHHLDWTIDEDIAYIFYSDSKTPSLESDLLADTMGAILASIFNLAQGSDFARLIRCPDYEREDLLKRIVGETEIPSLPEIAAQFDQAIRAFPMEIVGQGEESAGSKTAEDAGSHTNSATLTTKPMVDSGIGEITSRKTGHEPMAAGQKREVVVRRFSGKQPGGQRAGLTKIVDPEVCEKRALQFERLESRFSIKVSNVTGYDGPRCDILSFTSEEDRLAFMAQPTSKKRDLSSVVRFIEVKGRSQESTPISLKGNELVAARTFADKYYLYRLYMQGPTKYVLLLLQNPLNHPEAIEDVKDVYVSRADADRYDLDVTVESENGYDGS